MEKRRLGKSDLRIAPLMLGGNVFGWTADEATSFAILDAFLDAGFNAIDSADVYSAWAPGHTGGESESVLGKWMAARKNRDRVMLATKVGMLRLGDAPRLSKTQIALGVEASLKRLQTDYIDLYFAHRDYGETPLEETLDAFAELVKAGKVRVLGASNHTADRLADALAISARKGLPRYEAIEPQYSLVVRGEFEGALEKVCRDNGLGVLPYYALASGFLTGKYRTQKDVEANAARGGVAGRYLNDKGRKVLAALDSVGARFKAEPAQVALAWLMAKPAIAAPIASATSLAQLKVLVGAARLKLDAGAMAELDAASA